MLLVSVIIPTFNRPAALKATLASLAQQSLPPSQYEVIVVDDGTTGLAEPIAPADFPASLRYVHQANQGATRARNTGARASSGLVIVFLDDDITVSSAALADLQALCLSNPQTIVLGTLVTPEAVQRTLFGRLHSEPPLSPEVDQAARSIPFTQCKTGLLAIRREAFFEVGQFEDPGGGWPNWDDLDFGYRAHVRGFAFLKSGVAVGQHWDYALAAIGTAGQRWQRASRAAVRLFQKHPALQYYLPMFLDKTPPAWQQDPPGLLARKLLRAATARPSVMWALQRLAQLLERSWPQPGLLRPLYRWIIGGHIFLGYQQGMRELW